MRVLIESPYVSVWGHLLPWYGICILIGTGIANAAALREIRLRDGIDVNDFILAEGWGLLGAMIGSKLLYLILSLDEIEWSRMTDPSYFGWYMRGGFVFYGGLAGALLALFAAERLHHLRLRGLLNTVVFAIPLAHGFGRIGCWLTGCCYGIPYSGFGSVVYLKSLTAPNREPLFPVQLLEAVSLFLLSAVLLRISRSRREHNVLAYYILLYSVIRFLLEFLRGDAVRGHWGWLSTSQWISLLFTGACLFGLLLPSQRKVPPSTMM